MGQIPVLTTEKGTLLPLLVVSFPKPYMFEPHFIGSTSNLLDMYLMRNTRFPYVYTYRGARKPVKTYTSYSSICDTYIRDDIQVSGALQAGDILLTAQR